MVSTAKVSKYLKGMHFPADKQRVVSYAREHDAPDDVVGALKSMPDNEFDSMAGVWHAVGRK
jgi:NaMN:DMB phosphoribosyltransferase